MNINIKNLRKALEDLEGMPGLNIVKEHPNPDALREEIEKETLNAKYILESFITTLQEKAESKEIEIDFNA